ncbi:MAG: hypothetical protein ACLQVI_10640 [Polyangiaceae bacterium]
MRSRNRLGIVVAAVWACGVWACGGATFQGSLEGDGGSGSSSGGSSGSSSGGSSGSSSGGSSGSSSGGSSSSSSGGGSDGGTAQCPSSPPSEGAACPRIGLECEYGDSANPSCNEIVDCESSGWDLPSIGQTCPAGTCPATYADVSQGKSCSPAGLDCPYAQGECNCSNTPIATPTPVWQCSTPAAGCPEPRPRIGSPCTQTQSGLSCDYGACTGGAAVQCENGIWNQVNEPCPV